jgi:hypothetical protein
VLRLRSLAALVAAALALAAAGCGSDDDDQPATANTTAVEPAVVEAPDELPADLVADLEALCGEFQADVGGTAVSSDSQADEANAAAIDELQDKYMADLDALTSRVPQADAGAWAAYLAAQGAAFELSPPAVAGEPQPELDAANAAAEAQAAELGFSSCSGV